MDRQILVQSLKCFAWVNLCDPCMENWKTNQPFSQSQHSLSLLRHLSISIVQICVPARPPITHQFCLANIAFCLSIYIFRHFLVHLTIELPICDFMVAYYFQVSKLARRVPFIDLSKIWFTLQKCTVWGIEADLWCKGNQIGDRLCIGENLDRESQALAIYLYTPWFDLVAHYRTSSQNGSTWRTNLACLILCTLILTSF